MTADLGGSSTLHWRAADQLRLDDPYAPGSPRGETRCRSDQWQCEGRCAARAGDEVLRRASAQLSRGSGLQCSYAQHWVCKVPNRSFELTCCRVITTNQRRTIATAISDAAIVRITSNSNSTATALRLGASRSAPAKTARRCYECSSVEPPSAEPAQPLNFSLVTGLLATTTEEAVVLFAAKSKYTDKQEHKATTSAEAIEVAAFRKKRPIDGPGPPSTRTTAAAEGDDRDEAK